MLRRAALMLLPAAFVVGVLPALNPRPAVAAFPGENGRIAYSDETGIWTANPDGSDPQRLTTAPENHTDRLPQWSPGGTNILFQRQFGCCAPTYAWIVSAEGGDERQLLEPPTNEWDYAPAWSPDAAKVTFSSTRGEQEAPLGHPHLDIWTADPDGGNPDRLTFDGLENDTVELSRWSPDRRWIGFTAISGFDADFFPVEIIRPDGSGRRVLAPRADDGSFSWSPDGTQIAYTFTGGGKARIYIMDVATGSERILVQKSGGAYEFPTWSPDGTTIAFLHANTIFTVPVTGGPSTNIGIQAESIDWQPMPDFPLVDARFNSFESSIIWLYNEGLTTGCAPERYCPDRAVTRGELASFLSRALDLPPTTTDHFSDDDGTTHEDSINRVAEAGVVQGCGPDAFCPNDRLTRAELATFFVNAFDLPPTSTDHFTDDESSTHEANINALAESGITSGCAEDRYCPEAVVRRGQLAAFLRRAIES